MDASGLIKFSTICKLTNESESDTMEEIDRASEECMRRLREMEDADRIWNMHVSVPDYMQIYSFLQYFFQR